MTSNPDSPVKKKPKKKKKTDPFWPIVIILSILAFTGSFWFFYMLTSHINTRSIPTTDTPKLMLSSSPDLGGTTTQVGNNQGDPISPNPAKSPALMSASPVGTTPSAAASASTASAKPTATPSPTATPVPVPSRTPRPVVTPAAVVATPATAAKITYKVNVGSYSTRDEAQQVASQLGTKGYSATIIEDNGRFRLQLGAFDAQENALALAEEITQQGYEVVVRKGTP